MQILKELALLISTHPYHVMVVVGIYVGLDWWRLLRAFANEVVGGRCDKCRRDLVEG